MGLGWEQQGAIRGITIQWKAILSPGPCQILLHPHSRPAVMPSSPFSAAFCVTPRSQSPPGWWPYPRSPYLQPLLFRGSLGYNSPSLHLVILPIKSTARKAAPSATGKPGRMRGASIDMSCDGTLLGAGPLFMWWGSLMQLSSHGAGAGQRVEGQRAAASQSWGLNDLSTMWSVLACLNSAHRHAEGSAALSILPSSLQIVIRLLRVSKLLGS